MPQPSGFELPRAPLREAGADRVGPEVIPGLAEVPPVELPRCRRATGQIGLERAQQRESHAHVVAQRLLPEGRIACRAAQVAHVVPQLTGDEMAKPLLNDPEVPLHPRTRGAIARVGRVGELEAAGVRVLAPLGFRDTHALLANSRLVLTDSGGLLREAYFAGRFCVIPWEYAAWPELVTAGWADVGPLETQELLARLRQAPAPREPEQAGLFGSGDAGPRIVELVLRSGG